MGTTADRRVFVDTNVLAYATIPGSPRQFPALQALQRLDEENAEVWISRQVLRELAVVISHHLRPEETTTALRELERCFCIAEDSALVSEQLYLLLETIPARGKIVHDANIVATMLAHGISLLLTYNLADFERFSSLIRATDSL
jgi:predicted nucleic acid-binding protein